MFRPSLRSCAIQRGKNPSASECDPNQIHETTGTDHSKSEGTEELDGHRNAQRDSSEGLVDRPVHCQQADAEAKDDQPIAT